MIDGKSVKLSEYCSYPFEIPIINIDFVINDKEVNIQTLYHFVPTSLQESSLTLKGKGINLSEIFLDKLLLTVDDYKIDENELTIYKTPDSPFLIEIHSTISPFENTTLEGLYLSSTILTTQCEAEGFRRICFHPDRPDVLSRYKVRIEADKNRFPVLLSNGNRLSASLMKGCPERHEVVWEDPFPKPSYLFALVAGDLSLVSDKYITISGRVVDIKIYVEKGDENYTNHAVISLKKAMKWDEEKYGLEYDLNEYKIVAIRHFNMGAMENKGLNIFNSKLVLADSQIATDLELERIESVIAHEYFHNWTGNRVTCRDWFQLSLKEGLTVFRDQSFTADLHSAPIKRIEDVSFLRRIQFYEDQGPTSHAVKPKEYISIDNFYTTTIYEKGAELIRMLSLLLGHDNFIEGVKLYLSRYDGSAATTEDFISSVFEGAKLNGADIKFDINQFQHWYYEPGTPKVSIHKNWDPNLGVLNLQFEQSIKTTNIDERPSSFVIPILYNCFIPRSSTELFIEDRLFILDENKKELKIPNLPKYGDPPVISLFRGFSSPVNVDIEMSLEEYTFLLSNDNDYFSRWNASQILMRKAIIKRLSSSNNFDVENSLIDSLGKTINHFADKDRDFLASLLTIPESEEIENYCEGIDPLGLYKAREQLKYAIGSQLSSPLTELICKVKPALKLVWPEGKGERRLISVLWSYLALIGDEEVLNECLKAIETSSSMTLARGALEALKPIDSSKRIEASTAFFDRWKDNPVVLDAWFAYEASIFKSNSIESVISLLQHPKFDWKAPNAIRAVLGGFTKNIGSFHSLDGSGYSFFAEQLINVDRLNPITASRMIKTFSNWRKLIEPHKTLMREALSSLQKANLSSNTSEIVTMVVK